MPLSVQNVKQTEKLKLLISLLTCTTVHTANTIAQYDRMSHPLHIVCCMNFLMVFKSGSVESTHWIGSLPRSTEPDLQKEHKQFM